jgi:hypothetical protein
VLSGATIKPQSAFENNAARAKAEVPLPQRRGAIAGAPPDRTGVDIVISTKLRLISQAFSPARPGSHFDG